MLILIPVHDGLLVLIIVVTLILILVISLVMNFALLLSKIVAVVLGYLWTSMGFIAVKTFISSVGGLFAYLAPLSLPFEVF